MAEYCWCADRDAFFLVLQPRDDSTRGQGDYRGLIEEQFDRLNDYLSRFQQGKDRDERSEERPEGEYF